MNAQQLRHTAVQWLAEKRPAMVVHVAEIHGSTPRATDARMLVSSEHMLGTVGGGHLEWQAVSVVRQALQEYATHAVAQGVSLPAWQQRFALGPTLGQCCGGVVVLSFSPLTPDVLNAWPAPTPRFQLDLHGAGHVGQAIIQLLAGIDCQVRWIDQRLDERFNERTTSSPASHSIGLPDPVWQAALPAHIQSIPTDDAVAEVTDAPWGSHHLVITHRHDLDLAIVDALLKRDDIQQGEGWIGLIGSRSKRAAFEHRLRERGHAPELIERIACPIGLPGIAGKEPQVIAVSVVGQLLQNSTDAQMDNHA
jgi:xanthine dehydrogenase accessory factor